MDIKTISSVPVVPFALMFGIISAIIGLITGIIFAFVFGTMTSAIPPTSEVIELGWFRALFSIGAIVLMPVLGFAGGFIQGAIYAVLYNFLAPKIGGIQLRFKEEQQN